MRPINEWTRADLDSLVANAAQESTELEFKRSAALARTSAAERDLSKDISSLANSAGGTIIYGIVEHKLGGIPTAKEVDSGVDASEVTPEWLEQKLNSIIHPRIQGLTIKPITLAVGRLAYAILVPQSLSAGPHQASDSRYYKRYNFQSVPMQDFEVKDVMRRGSKPELFLAFKGSVIHKADIEGRFADIRVDIGNRASEPALYSSIELYVDARIAPNAIGELKALPEPAYAGPELYPLKGFYRNHTVPHQMPLYRERTYLFARFDFRIPDKVRPNYFLAYSLTTPGFSLSKVGVIICTDDSVSFDFPT